MLCRKLGKLGLDPERVLRLNALGRLGGNYREAEKTIGFWHSPAPKYNRGPKAEKTWLGQSRKNNRGQSRKNMAGPTPKTNMLTT